MRSDWSAAFAAAFLLLDACSPPSDIGKPCVLRNDGGVWNASSATDDFLDMGTPECENLVCLRPAGSDAGVGSGICSNSCTPQDPNQPNSPSDDCNSRQTGLVCRPVALDPSFVQAVEAEDGGAALLQQYLGGSNPYYCTLPQN